MSRLIGKSCKVRIAVARLSVGEVTGPLILYGVGPHVVHDIVQSDISACVVIDVDDCDRSWLRRRRKIKDDRAAGRVVRREIKNAGHGLNTANRREILNVIA